MQLPQLIGIWVSLSRKGSGEGESCSKETVAVYCYGVRSGIQNLLKAGFRHLMDRFTFRFSHFYRRLFSIFTISVINKIGLLDFE